MKMAMIKVFKRIHTSLLKVKILRSKARDRTLQKILKNFLIKQAVSGTFIRVLKSSHLGGHLKSKVLEVEVISIFNHQQSNSAKKIQHLFFMIIKTYLD